MEQNNKMQVFAYGEKVVRTLDREEGTWWVLKDVCRALNITDHKVVARRLDPDEVCQILSYNDDSFIRELYKDYIIIPTERASNLTGRYGAKVYKELIIKNF